MSNTKTKKILALIPARSGSLGLPNKNILDFCGKPLISYTIDVAQQSGIFDRIVVSTDSETIADISRAAGAEVPCLRPAALATADANIVDVTLHMLDHLRDVDHYEPELFFLLQPTSPLRDVLDIQNSLALFEQSQSQALVSVCRTHFEVFHIIDRKLVPAHTQEKELINRQERASTYKQDGSMIYIYNTNYFRQHPTFVVQGTTAYVVPKWKAVDIDDREDFELAEVLYKNRHTFADNI